MIRSVKRPAIALAVVVAVGVAAIQAAPYGHAHNNPPVTLEPSWDSPQTRELARKACFDCHSNQTHWPWYSNIAPVSWWIQNHVDEGRAAVNFSNWDRPQEGDDLVESVLEGKMPPAYYRPWDRLSSSETQLLAAGLRATFGSEAEGSGEHEKGRAAREQRGEGAEHGEDNDD